MIKKLFMHFSLFFFAAKSIKVFFLFCLRCSNVKESCSSFGGTSNTRFGMFHRLGNQRIPDNFLQQLNENARMSLGCLFRTPSMEWLTDVKMLVKICSLVNNFMGDFF